jgi:hypothetical protein
MCAAADAAGWRDLPETHSFSGKASLSASTKLLGTLSWQGPAITSAPALHAAAQPVLAAALVTAVDSPSESGGVPDAVSVQLAANAACSSGKSCCSLLTSLLIADAKLRCGALRLGSGQYGS